MPKHPTVAEYYNNNTRRFLRLGQHQHTRNIHQPLWVPQVTTLEEAVNWSNELVAQQLAESRSTDGETRVLDLGCGVGSSVFHLAARETGAARFWGVSISELQIELAKKFAASEPGAELCEFLCGDFLSLPKLPTMHLAYAIEAFVHATCAESFFASVANVLEPGGHLVLIDDVLTERGASQNVSLREQALLDEFRSGWLASSLISVEAATHYAHKAGLRRICSENLTGHMRLGRPRDQVIGLMRRVAGSHMRRSTYLRSLSGGYAKQQCLKGGLVEYRKLVFVAE